MTTKNEAKPRLYDILARAFAQEDVRVCFALLGDANMNWAARLSAQGCRMIYVRHEHCALAAAMAYARKSAEVGVATVTCGPGVTQLITALPAAAPPHIRALLARCLERDPKRRLRDIGDARHDLQLAIPAADIVAGTSAAASGQLPSPSAARPIGPRFNWLAGVAGVLLLSSVVGVWIWRSSSSGKASTAPDTAARSIAVLPFVNQSGNADDEYFSDGMSDELASALMKVPDLRVAARSSAFTFKGKNTDPREVGAKLNVATVLEGTVRRSGPRLRVTAQLVNTSDGLVRWAERYERETKDVFAVQDDITGAIVSALQLTLGANVLAGSKAGRTDNAEAHDLYLRGRFLVLKQTEDGLRKSLDYFAKALEKDPRYAPAYAGTALAHMWLADAFLPPREAEPKAKAAALKAIELDSTNAEAHTYLGLVKWFYDWEFENFELEFRRALHQWFPISYKMAQ